MRRGPRLGVWSVVWIASLAGLPLACAGKSLETGDAAGGSAAGRVAVGGGATTTAGTSNQGGSAGDAETGGNAGQAGATTSPPTRIPVNRFPCTSSFPVGQGLENCGTYTRRVGAVSCAASCADDCPVQCHLDRDCPAGQGCDCNGFPTYCVALGCTSDADCAAGFNCASYSNGCSEVGYACQLPSDECASNADCNDGSPGVGQAGANVPVCVYTTAGRRCSPGGCLR
jgi:hypothetical protein